MGATAESWESAFDSIRPRGGHFIPRQYTLQLTRRAGGRVADEGGDGPASVGETARGESLGQCDPEPDALTLARTAPPVSVGEGGDKEQGARVLGHPDRHDALNRS